tara:strand:+ start:2592 stop:2798 length:207 start_codon:yes stop_codon:yes gene_type:complete
MKKFNGFERVFIEDAIKHYTEEAEKEVTKNKEKTKGRPLFAEGYFTMVGKEVINKVNDMTLKKFRNNE